MLIDYLGWAATAVFVGSYFCAAETLKRLQMLGALMWVAYGFYIGASPVVAANLLVFAAAAWTTARSNKAQGSRLKAQAKPFDSTLEDLA